MLVAIVLRFPFLFISNYTHDELSALSRLQFDSITELFTNGIMVDGHPALVQLFLYGWTSLVGFSPWLVKLPFVLMGIGSVYLLYRLGKIWYSEITAVFAAAALALLQFPIFYSFQARPYSSGLFLLLLAALYLSQLIKDDSFTKRKVITYIVIAFLVSINHHFSALTLFFLVIGLFFLVKPEDRKKYILMNACIPILYLIHLPITIQQLSFGGLGGINGWLSPPNPDYLLKFFGYLFMYSWPMVIVFVAILLSGSVFRNRPNGISIVFVSIFILSYLTGHLYSILVSPILQHSFLLFCLPFLLLVLFSGLKEYSRSKFFLFFLFILTGSYTLLIPRQHEKTLTDQVFTTAPQLVESLREEFGLNDVNSTVLFNYNHEYSTLNARYTETEQLIKNFKPIDEWRAIRTHSDAEHDYAIVVNLLPGDERFVRHNFPELIYSYQSFLIDFKIYKKSAHRSEKPIYDFQSSIKKNRIQLFNLHPSRIEFATENSYRSYHLRTGVKNNPEWHIRLGEFLRSVNHNIEIEAEIETSADSGIVIGSAMIQNGKTIHWNTTSPKNTIVVGKNLRLLTMGSRLAHIVKDEIELSQSTFIVFAENKSGKPAKLKSLKIFAAPFSPWYNGIFEAYNHWK